MMSFPTDDETSIRPKLNLQPRSPAAAEFTSVKYTNKPSPFGAARPREQVLAEREGKNETDVLKEQAEKEWKGIITLTEQQREEKRAAETELTSARRELQSQVDPLRLRALREEVLLKERKLDALLTTIERLAVQAAQSGGNRRSHEWKREERSLTGYSEPENGFISFPKPRGYDAWGGGRARFNQCYACGEVGHFSRDCLNSGHRVGNYPRSRPCYSCGQEGHYSRECPVAFGGRPQAGYN